MDLLLRSLHPLDTVLETKILALPIFQGFNPPSPRPTGVKRPVLDDLEGREEGVVNHPQRIPISDQQLLCVTDPFLTAALTLKAVELIPFRTLPISA